MATKITPVSDPRRMTRSLFERVNERILSLRDDPRPHGVGKLAGALEGWRIRVGDHRILYQVDDEAQTETIVRVKHRREAYRQRLFSAPLKPSQLTHNSPHVMSSQVSCPYTPIRTEVHKALDRT